MNNPHAVTIRRSIRNEQRAFRSSVGFAALIICSLWIFVFWTTQQGRRENLEENGRELARMTYAVEEQSRRVFKLVEVFMLALDQWMAQNPAAEPRTDVRLAALVSEFRKTTGDLINIRLIADDGALHVLPGSKAQPATNVAGRDYASVTADSTQSGLFIGQPFENPATGKWLLPVSYPLKNRHHRIVMAMAAIELDALVQLFEQQRPATNGSIALVRKDGILLARAPTDTRMFGQSVRDGALFRALAEGSVRDVRIFPSRIDGVERQFGYAALSDYPLVVVVSASVADVLIEWRRNAWIAVAVATLLSLLTLLALWWQLSLFRSLAASRSQLEVLATTDAMTGVFNHSAFMEVLARDFARSRRYGETLTILMLDIDFFKRINDGYGHAVGDEALRSLARVLKSELRTVDSIGRLGGEEFGIILPNTAGDPALHLAERLRQQVADIVVKSRNHEEVRFTTSVGVAQMDINDIDAERLLARADAALYDAKAKGRNRVEVSLPLPAT